MATSMIMATKNATVKTSRMDVTLKAPRIPNYFETMKQWLYHSKKKYKIKQKTKKKESFWTVGIIKSEHSFLISGSYIPTPYAVSDLCHEPPKSVHRPAHIFKEDLKTNTSKSLYNYRPPEQHQDHVPISIDQRVYNIVETLNSTSSTSSHSYGSTNVRQQSHAPVTVEQRVYGLVEELKTPTRPDPWLHSTSPL